MKATFIYSEEEVKQAILDYHSRKITFSTRNYSIKVTLPGTVYVEDKPKPEKVRLPIINKLLEWAHK